MPWWSTLLLALGGDLARRFLVLAPPKAPIWVRITFVILAALAIIAAFVTVPGQISYGEYDHTISTTSAVDVPRRPGCSPGPRRIRLHQLR